MTTRAEAGQARRREIASIAKAQGHVTRSELVQRYGMSESTIAGDLQVLVYEKRLVLKRRGALPALWLTKERTEP